MQKKLQIFTGNANHELANQVARILKIPLGQAIVDRFSDGEIMVEILENVRGGDIFILQSTCQPINDNLMELMVMADAMRRASAARITAVIPYFGYARQDRRVRSKRVPISAKVVADMLASVGIGRLLTVDLHADQIQGFFHMPVDNIYASPIFLQDIQLQKYLNPIIVSPDVGGVVRARAVAKRLSDMELAIIDKRRTPLNETQVMNVIGDVQDKTCILIDDIVDTAGTLCNAAKALKNAGARMVVAYCTHPVLSGDAIHTIDHSMLDNLIVSDTIPLQDNAKNCARIRSISLTNILAEAIHRVSEEESLSSMFPA